MISLIDVGNSAVRVIFRQIISDDATGVYQLMEPLTSLPESELRARCRAALDGVPPEQPTGPARWTRRLRTAVSVPLGMREPDRLSLAHLALAVEAFSRVPADLPAGSMLYPEQIRAAVALTQPSLVQMDTGEGKTYAILPAAFALACRHYRVFIVCANDYLAWRDASRTRAYWEYLGITPGLCVLHTDRDEEWSARVVYTTLDALIFRSLGGEIGMERPSVENSYAAVLLDEADAILLDQAQGGFSIIRLVESSAFDWTFALEFAGGLQEEREVEVDRAELTAELTLEGERRLRERLGSAGSEASYFLTRFAVEASYVALRVVQEGMDYVILNDRLHPVDRITGKVERGRSAQWLIALEFIRGLAPRPKKVTLHETSPRLFFDRFPHVAGLSGTVVEDAAEYYFTYNLPTIVIAPRHRRDGKVESDYLFQNRGLAHRALVTEARAAVEAGRPVLVGTLSIRDAQDASQALREALPASVTVHCLTGKDDVNAAEVFAQAGTPGTVVVATQLGGRGVDIRLTDEARQNGGLALFSLGHAYELRHDRQFLGRAGRQGDPFTARFICCTEDPVLRASGGDVLRTLMEKLEGTDPELEPDGNTFPRWLIRQAQNRWRAITFLQRRTRDVLDAAQVDIQRAAVGWFQMLQLPVAEGEPGQELSPDFVNWVVEQFIERALRPRLADVRTLRMREGALVQRIVAEMLDVPEAESPVQGAHVEGRDTQTAMDVVSRRITEAVQLAAQRASEQLRAVVALSGQQVNWHNVGVLLSGCLNTIGGREGPTLTLSDPPAPAPVPHALAPSVSAGAETARTQDAAELADADGDEPAPAVAVAVETAPTAAADTMDGHESTEAPGAAVAGADDESRDADLQATLWEAAADTSDGHESAEASGAENAGADDESLEADLQATPWEAAARGPAQAVGDDGAESWMPGALQPDDEAAEAASGVLVPEVIVNVHEPLDAETEAELLASISTVHAGLQQAEPDPRLLRQQVHELVYQLLVLHERRVRLDGVVDALDALWAAAEPHVMRARAENPRSAAEYRVRNVRTPRSVAMWRIRSAWLTFLEQRDRTRYETGRRGYKSLDYFRLVTDRITQLWDERELVLPGQLLHDLLRVDRPWELDELFFIEDHQADDVTTPDPRPKYVWNGRTAVERVARNTTQTVQLVQQFIAHTSPSLDPESAAASSRRRVCLDFLAHAGLSTLHSPERIQKALESFLQEQAQREVSRDRLRKQKAWLRKFLIYLRKHNLIGPLPTFRTRARSAVARFGTTITERKTLIPLLGATGFVGAWMLLTFLGPAADAKVLHGLAAHLDRLLFGGLLAAGAVTAASLAVPTLLNMLATVLSIPKPYAALLPGKLALPVQVGFAAWITPWQWGSAPQVLDALVVFFTALFFGEVAKRTVWGLDQSTGVDLVSGWLTLTAAFVFFPAVVGGAEPWLALGCFAGAVVAAIVWHRVNRRELAMVSGRITGAGTGAIGLEPVRTTVAVAGSVGVGAHAFALAAAWLVYDLLAKASASTLALALATPAIYLLVVLYCAWGETRVRLAPERWIKRFNESWQRLEGADSEADVARVLDGVRRWLTVREFLFQSTMVLGVTALLYGVTVPGTAFAAAPAVVFAAMLVARLGEAFFTSVWHLLFSRAPFIVEQLDLSRVRDPKENLGFVQRLKNALNNRFVTVLTLSTILLKLITLAMEALKLIG
jgi:preprotein translocase subunit SecA